MNHDEAIGEIARTLSAQGGQMNAMLNVLLALIASDELSERTRALARKNLEDAFAVHNGASANPYFFDAFEDMRNRVLAALQEPQDGSSERTPHGG